MEIREENDFRVVRRLIYDDDFTGKIIWKGFSIHKAKYNQDTKARVKQLYQRRRDNGQCIRCGKEVKDINPRTDEPYRMCKAHR